VTVEDPGELRRSLSADILTEGDRPRGHCAVDGGLVIDLSRMRDVVVDPEARIARSGARSDLPRLLRCSFRMVVSGSGAELTRPDGTRSRSEDPALRVIAIGAKR